LAEGDTLRLTSEDRFYRRLGFSTFHDLCVEGIEMAASTGKRRVALSRLADSVPAVRTALLAGHLSESQALALRSVVTEETASWWIALAARSTVAGLRAAVQQAQEQEREREREREREEEQEQRNAQAQAHQEEREQENAQAQSQSQESEQQRSTEEESHPTPGRRISFVAPVAARLAFEEGIECARKTLGYDAPRHVCIAAMLAELSASGFMRAPDTAGTVTSDRERRAERYIRGALHPHRPFPTSEDANAAGPAEQGEPAEPAEPRDSGDPAAEGGSAHERPTSETDSPRSEPSRPDPRRPDPGRVPNSIRAAMSRAEETISDVYATDKFFLTNWTHDG
jgi:hypothetical protein